jgi:hypothetical protein
VLLYIHLFFLFLIPFGPLPGKNGDGLYGKKEAFYGPTSSASSPSLTARANASPHNPDMIFWIFKWIFYPPPSY